MDEQVIAAMARWPNVPAVFGWLSLTESGQWRLHPQGDALQSPNSAGEEITSPQILAFMSRNYAVDDSGQWFFQNGPQRVYVRLDAAPYVVHTTVESANGCLRLRTHTGLDIPEILALHLDDIGRLYADTPLGAALIAGRDLPALLDALQGADSGTRALGSGAPAERPADPSADIHETLARCLETGTDVQVMSQNVQGFPPHAITLHYSPRHTLEARLGFRRQPLPPAGSARPSSGPSPSSP